MIIFPPPDYRHSDTYFFLMRDLRTACVWVATASLLANLLPHERRFRRWPRVRHAYVWLVDFVALLALNFRVCLPSLQAEFMGFRRKIRGRVHACKREG